MKFSWLFSYCLQCFGDFDIRIKGNMTILQLVFTVVLLGMLSNVNVQAQFTPQEQGMSVSLFQFDPSQLGIYNKPAAKPKSRLRRQKIHLAEAIAKARHGKMAEKQAIPNTNNFSSEKNATEVKNSTTSETKNALLNFNPTPSSQAAMKHLHDVKFDGRAQDNKANSSSLLSAFNKNNTNVVVDGPGNSTVNATKQILPKEELLFYRNKTNSGQDGSEQATSVKLTKTTSPDSHQDSVPIVQTFNATKLPKNASLATLQKNNGTRNVSTGGDSVHFKNGSTNLDLSKNATMTDSDSAKNVNSTTFNETVVKESKRKRDETLSHFIPTISASNAADRKDSFQSGSRKHTQHKMYPDCYQCPKSSNYTDCVRKANLQKCNEGLNNICYAKSHKAPGNGGEAKKNAITYEMGCTNHKNCGDAKAFPCRDGSKSCFTCCQFDNCNASPHHGDFEKDEINLEELTKDKAKESTKGDASKDVAINVVVMAICFYLALLVF